MTFRHSFADRTLLDEAKLTPAYSRTKGYPKPLKDRGLREHESGCNKLHHEV